MIISLPGRLYLGRLSPSELHDQLDRARAAEPNYAYLGSTLAPEPGPGEYADSIDVGAGERAFASARDALQTWVAQRGIGAEVVPTGQGVELGATVIFVVRRGPVFFLAVDRVVAVIDEPRRYVFAYGTLPGHPERGEESFTVEWLADDRVRVTIRVRAESSTLTGRIAGPLVHRIQRAALGRYLRAIAEHVGSVPRSLVGAPDMR